MLLSPGTDTSHTSSSSAGRLRQTSSPIDDGLTEDSSQSGVTSDSYNPMFPPTTSGQSKDPLGRKQPTALPSYLKIPTLIPSAYASPTSSAPPSPPVTGDDGGSFDDDLSGTSAASAIGVTPPQTGMRLGLGGTAAAAILNTEDVVLGPGEASKVSSPLTEDPDSSQDTEPSSSAAGEPHSTPASATTISAANVEDPVDHRGINSRTPTPTPGSLGSGRAMTPTETRPGGMSSLSPAVSSAATETNKSSGTDSGRRPSLQLYTGTESGAATPALPIGLTSAPSSALTPAIPTYGSEGIAADLSPSTPLTKETNNLRLTLPPTTPPARDTHGQHSTPGGPSPAHTRGPSAATPTANRASGSASQNVPLIPIVVKWRGGGKEVFVTGTFANEWRSKILLRKSPTSSGKRPEYSCVLHLAPGTHRLKFIVDDRWRVSRDLSTASDGEGNLTNYIEVAHTGPAHPGPLSAPGEDLLAPEEDEEKRKRGGLAAHRAAVDLVEEARRAEELKRGNLLDVFGEDKVRPEERWTQDIPPSIVKAQAAEEAYRTEMEARSESHGHHHRSRDAPPADVPAPPTLPRQLEKVILNSTSAAVLGTVDDNSVLPAPNHAVLHHLTASAIKSGVIATGCTVRYRKKYITTVYYRAAS